MYKYFKTKTQKNVLLLILLEFILSLIYLFIGDYINFICLFILSLSLLIRFFNNHTNKSIENPIIINIQYLIVFLMYIFTYISYH